MYITVANSIFSYEKGASPRIAADQMLINLLPFLNAKKIILASGSPRRKEILTNIGLLFDIVTSNFEENLDKSQFPTPESYVVTNALYKAKAVHSQQHPEADIVIGADTVVCIDGKILEKPVDEEDAFRILSMLSGRSHSVYTGVVISLKPNNSNSNSSSSSSSNEDENVLTFCEQTKVQFAPLSEELIRSYIATREPMDKAGAYGIQGFGGSLVSGVEGCYFNVMGFPVHKFTSEIVKLHSQHKL